MVHHEAARFHAERRTGVGGSDAAAACGIDPYRTMHELWLEKTGQSDGFEGNEYTRWGTLLEPIVAQRYKNVTGNKVRVAKKMYRHKEYPFIIAHIDRLIVNSNKILECKTASAWTASKWGENGSDEIPENYMMQVQHYMLATYRTHADLAVLIGGNDFRIYNIQRNEKLIAELIEREREFWKFVETNTPPPKEADDYAKMDLLSEGFVEADNETMQVVGELKVLRKQIKDLEKQEDEKSQAIKRLIGEKEGISWQGSKIATWKAQSRRKIDFAMLKEHVDQEVIDECMIESSSRIFKIEK